MAKGTCVSFDIPAFNQSYPCFNVTWQPRVSEGSLLAIMIVPSILTSVLWVYAMWKLPGKLYQLCPREKTRSYCFSRRRNKSEKKTSCVLVSVNNPASEDLVSKSNSVYSGDSNTHYSEEHVRKIPLLQVVILPLLKLTWDAIDVVLDLYIFYEIEKGNILHKAIIRNTYVNNAILVFALIGCLKILLCVLNIQRFLERVDVLPDVGGQKHLLQTFKVQKAQNHLITFFFEDCAELFLEYFFIEKYIMEYPSPVLIIKDIILAIIALGCLIIDAVFGISILCKSQKQFKQHLMSEQKHDFISEYKSKYAYTFGGSVLVALINFLRVGGAGYQYITGKLHPNCLEIVDGVLVQTPFAEGCLREVDYLILLFNFLPIPMTILAFKRNIMDRFCICKVS